MLWFYVRNKSCLYVYILFLGIYYSLLKLVPILKRSLIEIMIDERICCTLFYNRKLLCPVALNLYLFLSTSACGMQKKNLPCNASFHSPAGENEYWPNPASTTYFSLITRNKSLSPCYIFIFLFR